MTSFTKREQVVILLIVLGIISSLGFKFLRKDIIERKENLLEIESLISEVGESDIIEEELINEMIMIHISGQVYFPGVVELEAGKRVKDAVEMAGGLKNEADLDRINLAKKLEDEEKIYIPKIGEIEDMDFETMPSKASQTGKDSKLNINTCNKVELITLPGIGDVLANRILEYRSTNKFNSIEDIKNVSGIGEKKFESIKDLIKTK